MRMILSSHKITYAPSQGGVVTVSTTHTKILCQSSECLPSGCGEEVCIPKLFESFLLSPFPILKNMQIIYISKTVQKVVPNIFEINLKIN